VAEAVIDEVERLFDVWLAEQRNPPSSLAGFRAGWQAREQEVRQLKLEAASLLADEQNDLDILASVEADRDRALAEVGRLTDAVRALLDDAAPVVFVNPQGSGPVVYSVPERRLDALRAALQPRGEGDEA
jgi:hypothetical protein